MELLVTFASHKTIPSCGGSIVIFDGCWKKTIFQKHLLVYQGIQFGKNMMRPFFIVKFVFMVGYYNEFTAVQRKMLVKYLLKTMKKMRGMNPMGLSAPCANSFKYFCLASSKKCYKRLAQWTIFTFGKLPWDNFLQDSKKYC